jgi:hypothetical protein
MAKNIADLSVLTNEQATLKNVEPPPPPTRTYDFAIDSFDVVEPRSGAVFGLDKGNDSDYVGFALQVNNTPAQQLTKFIGNNCHSGVFPVDLSFNSIQLADTDAIVLVVTIVNSSQGETATTKYLSSVLSKLASVAGSQLGKFATNEILTQSVKDEIAAGIGAALGTAVVPLIGSALGALAGLLVSSVWGVVFPNCDGPVVASMFVYSGAELKGLVASGQPYLWTVNYPGVDSPDGCGDNSKYNVSYRVTPVPPKKIIGNIQGVLDKANLGTMKAS